MTRDAALTCKGSNFNYRPVHGRQIETKTPKPSPKSLTVKTIEINPTKRPKIYYPTPHQIVEFRYHSYPPNCFLYPETCRQESSAIWQQKPWSPFPSRFQRPESTPRRIERHASKKESLREHVRTFPVNHSQFPFNHSSHGWKDLHF